MAYIAGCLFATGRRRASIDVVVPERLGVAHVAAVELGAIPAVEWPHGLRVAHREVGGAATLDEVGEQKFRVFDRPAVGLRTVPTIHRAERLGQLLPQTKTHKGWFLRRTNDKRL